MTTTDVTRFAMAIALVAVVGLVTANANAQITVESFASWNSGTDTGPNDGTVENPINAYGSDKLVVVSTGEHGFNQTGNGDGGAVTFNGIAMTQLINRDTIKPTPGPVDDTWNDIWYLDAADYTGGAFPNAALTVQALASSRANVTVFALTGTADGAGNTVIGTRDTSSANLTTSAGSIVIASYGMGGNGNTAALANVTTNAPLIEVSRQENGSNWDGHVVGYANGVAAGTATYSFTDTSTPDADGRTGAHVIAAEFLLGPPPPLLTLRVNTTSGAVLMLGDDAEPVTMNYYQVTSAGGSLDETRWLSLADQDYDGNGPPNGTGNGWEEAGGSRPQALAEAYLLGSSTIAAAASINLGSAYDNAVDAQDLVFTYLTNTGKQYEGVVDYIAPLPGDADLDGDIDNADLGAAAGGFTGAGGSGMRWAEGDFDGDGDVDNADLGIAAGAFTGSLAGSLSANVAAIPEPASLALLGAGGLAMLARRRR